MLKEKILRVLKEKIENFKLLPKYIQEENSSTLNFLKEQYYSIKYLNKFKRNSIWSPSAIFELKGLKDYKSLLSYFEDYGCSIDNIIGIKDLSVLDSKRNIYFKI